MEENKKYNIIYADPPWDYGNTKNLDGEFWGMADKHYDVMKFKDICNLPIQNIAADDCYLFLWVTSPFLEKGFEDFLTTYSTRCKIKSILHNVEMKGSELVGYN